MNPLKTFTDTQHLKPRTWLKNLSCAGLIALSPFTSGSAALNLVLEGIPKSGGVAAIGSIGPALTSLGRLSMTLFAGFMSREILMDIIDIEGDRAEGVRTIPAKYGKRLASRVALAFASAMGLLCSGVPGLALAVAWKRALAQTASYRDAALTPLLLPFARQFLLGVIGSGMIVWRAVQVVRSEGEDLKLAARAVEEAKDISILFVLASFL
mgnify:CR=1 FL=1|jgi:4-hydroxybenzoate polyprenyltransferase